ncbi:IS630 family transposase [Lichenihabitans sp. Uapishka_5]|uniref:IS630 family transposase n=1 Tax=Lichenihabitans sp. Uapishka_5 TaxID=3037302 RepID=UPI0029E8168B|nr:IS630 family transposase [Lichenihabitans sp. Uapishka_5]MDX7953959.1 IS630 family transposase [Lichenihabitans sp. Uapishka_5]
MATPIPLRSDFDSTALRRMARVTKDADQARRFLALARIYDGGSRTEAATIGSVTLQIVRDWVVRFNAQGPNGLLTGRSPGSRPKLGDEQRQALARMVESGPIPAIHGVVRWRRKDLAHWIFEEFGISLDETTVGRELKALGFAKLSARPRHHAQNELKVDAFEKNFPAELAAIQARLPRGTEIEVWFQDEARRGQKNKITRRWAELARGHGERSSTGWPAEGKRGTRPSAPQDQRTMWTYIFGAICPKKGKGAGLVMPYCDTGAMNRHLTEISATVDPGAHAVLILDQAGWHATPNSPPASPTGYACWSLKPAPLTVPDNITLLFLPPRAPELNPQENVWQFMRDTWLSNRIFADYNDIVGRCCEAWNKLVEQPWIIMSIGLRDWAHAF